jgi:fibronectin type 3 domain-containing protein
MCHYKEITKMKAWFYTRIAVQGFALICSCLMGCIPLWTGATEEDTGSGLDSLALAALGGAGGAPGPQTFVVSGTLTDAGGGMLANTDVTCAVGAYTVSVRSDTNGNIVISLIPGAASCSAIGAGTFTVTVFTDGSASMGSSAGVILVIAVPGPSPTVIPLAPADLAANPGDGTIALNWSPVGGATRYRLYGNTTGNVTLADQEIALVTGTSYTHSGLSNGVTRYYRLVAENDAGASGAGNQVSATPTPGSPPVPTGVQATAADRVVNLNWQASAGATAYQAYWSTSPGVTVSDNLINIPSGTTLAHAGRTNGTTYFYRFAAVGPFGVSALSAEVSARPIVLPAQPSGVSVTGANGQATIRWSAVPGATEYRIHRSTSAGVTTASPAINGITGVSHTDTGLTNGTAYYYRVLALNAFGAGELSSEVQVTPGQLYELRVAISGLSSGALTLQNGADEIDITSDGTHTFAVRLANGAAYDVRVKTQPLAALTCSVLSGSGSVAGGHVTLTGGCDSAPPPAPRRLRFSTGPTDGRIDTHWLGDAAARGYDLFWDLDPNVTTADAMIGIPGGGLAYAHTGLTNAQEYCYAVRAYNFAGTSALTAPICNRPQAAGTWVSLPDMPVVLYGHNALYTEVGIALMNGGRTGSGSPTNTRIYRYDPRTNQYMNDAYNPESDFYASMVRRYAGQTYRIGGSNRDQNVYNREHYAYDDVTWSGGPVPSIPDLTHSKRGMMASIVGNSYYTFGGHNRSGGVYGKISRFNMDTRVWTDLGHMPAQDGLTGKRAHGASVVIGDKIYIVGGRWSTHDFQIHLTDQLRRYDPATDAWQALAPIPTPREKHTAVVYNGKIYVVGGTGASGLIAGMEVYDPSTDTWSSVVGPALARESHAAAVMDGYLYVFGHFDAAIRGGASAERYRF